MNALYDIPDDLMPMQDLLRSTGGDLSDPDDAAVIDEYLDEGEQALEDKLESYCRLIREFEVRSAAKRLEADRLRTRSTIDSNAARSLKDRLQDFLERQERTEVQTPGFDISVQKNGGLQRIDFIGEVPQEFRKPGEPDRSRQCLYSSNRRKRVNAPRGTESAPLLDQRRGRQMVWVVRPGMSRLLTVHGP